MPRVPALTAKGSTAARPNSQPPAGRPGQFVAHDLPRDKPGVGLVQAVRLDQPGHAGHRGGVAQRRAGAGHERGQIDQPQPGAVGEDRRGQGHDDRGPGHVHGDHQAAPVGSVDHDAQAAAEQQPRQALYRGDRRHRGRRAGQLRREQRERRQPDAVPEVGQEPGQPVPGERRPEPGSEGGHPSIMPEPGGHSTLGQAGSSQPGGRRLLLRDEADVPGAAGRRRCHEVRAGGYHGPFGINTRRADGHRSVRWPEMSVGQGSMEAWQKSLR